jgi:hypothetical protein
MAKKKSAQTLDLGAFCVYANICSEGNNTVGRYAFRLDNGGELVIVRPGETELSFKQGETYQCAVTL